MKFEVNGNSLVVTSSIKKEDYELLAKFKPEVLKVKDADGNVIFHVCKSMKGYANENGVGFNGATRDDNEFLTLTMDVAGIKDVKTYITDMFGAILPMVDKIEAEVVSAAATTQAARQAFMNSIKIA